MPEQVTHFMANGTYVGTDRPELIGKTGLVRVHECGKTVMVQADYINTGYGFGWHEFPAQDWQLHSAVDWSK